MWGMDTIEILALLLGSLLVLAGVGHVLARDYFLRLVPSWLPHHRAVVLVSGIADVVAGALLLAPSTRQLGGAVAATLISVYLVPHLDAARTARRDGPLLERPWAVVGRVLTNVGYVAIGVVVALG